MPAPPGVTARQRRITGGVCTPVAAGVFDRFRTLTSRRAELVEAPHPPPPPPPPPLCWVMWASRIFTHGFPLSRG